MWKKNLQLSSFKLYILTGRRILVIGRLNLKLSEKQAEQPLCLRAAPRRKNTDFERETALLYSVLLPVPGPFVLESRNPLWIIRLPETTSWTS